MSYPKQIQFFFNESIEKIKNVLDPEFILIAGSFGKESWLYSSGELISDFELVFVCKRKWVIKDKNKLQKKLNKEYPYEISLKGYLLDKIKKNVISNYAFKNPGYISLDFFDTFSKPKLLYSKSNGNLNIQCRAEEIPIWEAWRLYVNRMGDLMDLEFHEYYDPKQENYYWLKIFESTVDAYCIINKIYDKDILQRLKIFKQELIENDLELSEVCKESFPILNEALLARYNHDLKLFKNNLSLNERKKIVNSWASYFENKLSRVENIQKSNKQGFYINYLNNKGLQNKYLGHNYCCNILTSNVIRLFLNPSLLNSSFKFYNQNVSWRHTILLCISSIYHETNLNSKKLHESKEIASRLIAYKSLKNMSDKDLLTIILKYWKILR